MSKDGGDAHLLQQTLRTGLPELNLHCNEHEFLHQIQTLERLLLTAVNLAYYAHFTLNSNAHYDDTIHYNRMDKFTQLFSTVFHSYTTLREASDQLTPFCSSVMRNAQALVDTWTTQHASTSSHTTLESYYWKISAVMTFGRYSGPKNTCCIDVFCYSDELAELSKTLLHMLLDSDDDPLSAYDTIMKTSFVDLYTNNEPTQQRLLPENIPWKTEIAVSSIPYWFVKHGPPSKLVSLFPIIMTYVDDYSMSNKMLGMDMLDYFLNRLTQRNEPNAQPNPQPLLQLGLDEIIIESLVKNQHYLDDSQWSPKLLYQATKTGLDLVCIYESNHVDPTFEKRKYAILARLFEAGCLYVWQYKLGHVALELTVLSYLQDLVEHMNSFTLRYETAIIAHLCRLLETTRSGPGTHELVQKSIATLASFLRSIYKVRLSLASLHIDPFRHMKSLIQMVARATIIAWGANTSCRSDFELDLRDIWGHLVRMDSATMHDVQQHLKNHDPNHIFDVLLS